MIRPLLISPKTSQPALLTQHIYCWENIKSSFSELQVTSLKHFIGHALITEIEDLYLEADSLSNILTDYHHETRLQHVKRTRQLVQVENLKARFHFYIIRSIQTTKQVVLLVVFFFNLLFNDRLFMKISRI